jgi:alkylated DNA repair protein (DNA oxidative demethylase)
MPVSSLEVAPGAIHLKHYLSEAEQQAIAALCFEIAAGEAGFYTPIVRGGHPMSVRMLCLGRHWNALTYSYQDQRLDVDGRPAPPLPSELGDIARRAAADAGFTVAPDTCIVNWYVAASKMGMHQDKDESAESIARGAPVVSLSIGDTARFLFGGLRRRDPVEKMSLESGDAFVFGGPARLRYHGVTRIEPGTGPAGLPFEGRLNLTFREF